MSISKCLSLRIKQILKEKKLTMYRLEMLTGISHSTLSALLNCRYNACNIKTVFIIIEALEMKISDFFDDDLFSFCSMDLD